jgi:hypothetical protein
MSELEDSIESKPHSFDRQERHSELVGVSGDLPTPPYGHPSEEGILLPRCADFTVVPAIMESLPALKNYNYYLGYILEDKGAESNNVKLAQSLEMVENISTESPLAKFDEGGIKIV